jgi:hypothetical protein
MASEEQKQVNREVIAKQQEIIVRAEWHCCGNCNYLRLSTGGAEHCTLYDCLPPLAVLLVGCESWEQGATL